MMLQQKKQEVSKDNLLHVFVKKRSNLELKDMKKELEKFFKQEGTLACITMLETPGADNLTPIQLAQKYGNKNLIDAVNYFHDFLNERALNIANHLEKEKALLPSGPVCIGEDHRDSITRNSLKKLIADGHIAGEPNRYVKKLFLEIPACSREVQLWLADPKNTDMDKMPPYVAKYLQDLSTATQKGDNTKIRWVQLITYAKEKGVAVYCHDLPVCNTYPHPYSHNVDQREIINPSPFFEELLKESGVGKDKGDRIITSAISTQKGENSGVQIRDIYSKALIKECTQGNMEGVVIFGGTSHFKPAHANNSLQVLCGVAEGSVFCEGEGDINKKVFDSSHLLNKTQLYKESGDNLLHTFIRENLELLKHLEKSPTKYTRNHIRTMKKMLGEIAQQDVQAFMVMMETPNAAGLTPAGLAHEFGNKNLIGTMSDFYNKLKEKVGRAVAKGTIVILPVATPASHGVPGFVRDAILNQQAQRAGEAQEGQKISSSSFNM